jgi:cellulose synthase/poly-beta-1,6-N-acetylglucosamine synthase-like glycosyltransferase
MGPRADSRLPFVSVVLPARNEERFIRNCLQSLLATEYPADRIEFLVVDGDSDDNTAGIVLQMSRVDRRIKLLRNPRRTVPQAMNTGIRASRGDVIVRVDAHAEYPANYIRQSVHALIATGADNVGGTWRTLPGSRSPMAQAIALALTHSFGVGNASFRVGGKSGFVDTVPFGAFRREVFEQVGLFNECLTRHQDYELNSRIRRSGGTVYLDRGLQCNYYARPTLWSLLKQKLADGRWCVYSWSVCPEAYAFRHAFPGIVTAVALLLGAAAILMPATLAILALCAGSYVVAVTAATIDLLTTRRSLAALLCPLVFPVLHFGMGIGVIAGLVTVRGWARRVMADKPAPRLAVKERVLEETAA